MIIKNMQGADLRGANLQDANLRGANLQSADLRGADLQDANLQGANLQDANLRGANLQSADLRGANLQGADLWGADLWGADLRGANLRGANLQSAKNIPEQVGAVTRIIPESGTFIGWKKCVKGVIVKLQIPAKAKRSNATGRKCRASHAKVLEVFGAQEGVSQHDSRVIYRKGETVKAHEWCEDRWQECAGGIHFFITRWEAEQY